MLVTGPWQVVDELIEQPSWGGRFIIDLKGLSDSPEWIGKKVGQSYELAGTSQLINPATSENVAFRAVVKDDPDAWLGDKVVKKYGSEISLLIKLTQAKGNSFQVHLPESKSLKHWKPKPEAWFYLAPGLFTFGLKPGSSYEDFSEVLLKIDSEMHRLSDEVKAGAITVDSARTQAAALIAQLNPSSYINIVHAKTDDIVDLTAGGIHHSWEEDNENYPDGNLVYEVQVDVQDEYCSMRGFDKGKFLNDGSLRPSHVADYLSTIEQDDFHNNLANHIRKPELISVKDGTKVEALFRTPYFDLDRLILTNGSKFTESTANGFHHLFVLHGNGKIGERQILQGQSYIVPAVTGEYDVEASHSNLVVLKTYLPV